MPHHLAPHLPAYRGLRQVPFPYLMRLADDTQVRLRLKHDSPFTLRQLDGQRFPSFEEARQNADPLLAWSDQHELSSKQLKPDGYSYALYEGDRLITTLSFEPKLAWSNALTEDGTPFKATGLSQHGDMMVLNPAPGCEYFVAPFGHEKKNLSCQFCLYGLPDQRMNALGQTL